MIKRVVFLLMMVLGAGLLTACDTAEERAQKHFEKGMALLEAGDTDRALVEFRNVFKLNSTHRDARLTYAQVEEKRGNISSAYGQYLRLVEQYPDDLDGQRALARLALAIGNWDEVERHVAIAKKLAPDDLDVQAIELSLNYRNAVLGRDTSAIRTAAAAAAALVEKKPDQMNARRVVIDDFVRGQDWRAALSAIDASLAVNENDQQMHRLRLAVLERLGRTDEVETHLLEMVERFPDDESINRMLITWYVTRQQIAEAESYLRGRVAQTPDSVERQVQLVGFLAQYRGRDAARDEIERVLAETDLATTLFRSMRAGLDFDAGQQDAAVSEMEDILKEAEPSDETRGIKLALAKMLIRTGNSVGARSKVEEVLAEDPTNVGALKLKAGWLIDDDHTGDAIVELRRALDQSPRDAEIMTLLARAYEREGNHDLKNEMLALAVEASNSAPAEALRYARVLLSEGKQLPAEDVLLAALRLQRDNPELLIALGNVYVQMSDWPRADQVIDTLTKLGTDIGQAGANELTARKLAGQNRETELTDFLGKLSEEDGGLGVVAAIVRNRLASGDVEGAREYINKQLADDPENPALRFVAATVLMIDGQAEAAEAMFRKLLDEDPKRANVWMALYTLHRSRGEAKEAQLILDQGLEALPENTNLNWLLAGEREAQGDIEGAIAIYEKLYERDSNSPVLANNLASLISSHYDDDENLERAITIARRLRGTKVAAFQDTYGWITYRLGNHEEALEYLEPAALGIPDDPMVHFHLAMTYVALKRDVDALAQLNKAVELIEASGKRPELLDDVQAEITRAKSRLPIDN